MKKILTAVFCIAVFMSAMTGCNGKNDESDSREKKIKDVSAKDIATVIANTDEWPKLVEISDKAELKEYMLIDADNKDFKEVYALKPGISGAISEIIVIKAQTGKVANAKRALEARKDKLINDDAFYPEHKTWAQNSAVQTIGDYAFLICNHSTENAVKAVEDFIYE